MPGPGGARGVGWLAGDGGDGLEDWGVDGIARRVFGGRGGK
jgi:hypothetical protein